MNERSKEVSRAVRLLEESETCADYELRAKQMGAAMEILNAHLRANPNSAEQEYIGNIKFSFTQRYLLHLSRVKAGRVSRLGTAAHGTFSPFAALPRFRQVLDGLLP